MPTLKGLPAAQIVLNFAASFDCDALLSIRLRKTKTQIVFADINAKAVLNRV
jgi:hypothetical protein